MRDYYERNSRWEGTWIQPRESEKGLTPLLACVVVVSRDEHVAIVFTTLNGGIWACLRPFASMAGDQATKRRWECVFKAFTIPPSLYFKPLSSLSLSLSAGSLHGLASDQWINGSRPLKLLWHFTNKQRVITERQRELSSPNRWIKDENCVEWKEEYNYGCCKLCLIMICTLWVANIIIDQSDNTAEKISCNPCWALFNWFCSVHWFRFFFFFVPFKSYL